MFTTKIESSHSWATSAVSPSATMIETIASTIGSAAATTAPKTSRSTRSAAGRPKRSSPFSRSLCETSLKSRLVVNSPVTATANPSRPSASCTVSIRSSTVTSSSGRSCTGTSAAWLSSEKSPSASYGETICSTAPVACSRSMKRCTSARNAWSCAVVPSLRMITSSVVSSPTGRDCSSSRSARTDSGLFVTAPSLVRLPPRRVATNPSAITMAAIHAPIVRHGCAAAARANRSVTGTL